MDYGKTYIYLLILLNLSTAFSIHAQKAIKVPENLTIFTDIELTIEREVQVQIQEKINSLTRSKLYFRSYIERCALYFPHIESIFLKEDIPEDFKYLAIQESALIADAVSQSNAVGFWQFKAHTGREVGLKINKHIDERKNIIAATFGAASYLKRNNNLLHNWLYTLLSYNYGLTGAMDLMKRSLKNKKRITLGNKTPLYIIHFLAHKIAFERALSKTIELDTYLIAYPSKKERNLLQIAEKMNISKEEIRLYNKWLKTSHIPSDKIYWVILALSKKKIFSLADREKGLFIPYTFGEELFTRKNRPDTHYVDNSDKFPILIKKRTKRIRDEIVQFALVNGIPGFISQKGQNLLVIAEILRTTQTQILKKNDMNLSDELEENQPYYLKTKKNKAKVPFHTVEEGETAWEISQKYGVKLKSLLRRNRLRRDQTLEVRRILSLQKKQKKKLFSQIKKNLFQKKQNRQNKQNKLKMDSLSQDKVDSASNLHYHIVVPGENIFAISKKYDVNIFDLKKWNNLNSNLSIEVGEKLVVDRSTSKNSRDHYTSSNQELNKFVISDPTDTIIPHYKSRKIKKRRNNIKSIPIFGEEDTSSEILSENRIKTKEEKISYITHIVALNETLWKIANKYNVSIENLQSWNKIEKNSVYLGQALKIEVKNEEKEKIHLVKKGETLYTISQKYSLSLADLILWNKLTEQFLLQPGQTLFLSSPLKIKENIEKKNEINRSSYHIVKKGDTLFSISKKYTISLEKLKRLNGKFDNQISIGEQLKIE